MKFLIRTFPFILKVLLKRRHQQELLSDGTEFLEDSVVDHFFISYLQQDTFLPKEKKSIWRSLSCLSKEPK